MKLNEQQQEAVVAEGHVVVVAPPGSGKTRVLVERAKHILRVHDDAIVRLVTFTRNAAQEMKNRIGDVDGRSLTAATFDSYCLRMMQWAGKKIRPATNVQHFAARMRAMENLSDDAAVGFDNYLNEASSLLDLSKASAKAQECYAEYTAALKSWGVADFASIARAVAIGMEDENSPIRPLSATHLLVDEFQDADRLQLAWVLAHQRAGAIVTVVGDDDQAIYSWRGGLGYHAMSQVEEELQASRVMLNVCYRSRPEVTEKARLLINHNKERFAKQVWTPRPVGGAGVHWHVEDEEAAAQRIVAYLERAGWPRFGVLARRNIDLNYLETKMNATGRKIGRLGGTPFWARAGAQAALNLFMVICDEYEKKDLSTLLQWMRVPASQHIWAFPCIMDGAPPGRSLDNAILELSELVTNTRRMLANNASSPDVADRVIDFLAKQRNAGKGQRWPGIEAAYRAAMSIQGLCEKEGGPKLLEGVKWFASLANNRKDETDESYDGHLATMHASKGMEWPVVFIVAANEGITPVYRGFTKPDEATMEEERRLFYVALTRAEDEVHVYSYNQIKDLSFSPSPFIKEARLTPAHEVFGDEYGEFDEADSASAAS